jgi:hypothetical protein
MNALTGDVERPETTKPKSEKQESERSVKTPLFDKKELKKAARSYWRGFASMLGIDLDKRNKIPGVIWIGKGMEQFSLRKLEDGRLGVINLNDPNNILRILDFTSGSNELDAVQKVVGLYEDDPRNNWRRDGFLNRSFEYFKATNTEQDNYYIRAWDELDENGQFYYYEFEEKEGAYLMQRTDEAVKFCFDLECNN